MFQSLASCFAFRCSASLNMTTICRVMKSTLFASGLWLGEGRCNFDLSNFAARLAAGFELDFLPRICPGAEKQNPCNLPVNGNFVEALIEIVCCCCCFLPVIRDFLWRNRRGPGLNDFHQIGRASCRERLSVYVDVV